MAIKREQAFPIFEELLAAGLRPSLSGFCAQDDTNQYWPAGSEGFFVSAGLESTREAPETIERLSAMQEIAVRHGLTAWFVGAGTDYQGEDGAQCPGIRVHFEQGLRAR